MLERPRGSLPILALLLLLPQSVYVIGNYLAIGIRFPFFRFQASSLSGLNPGTMDLGRVSVITVVRELRYLTSGIIPWTTSSGRFNSTAIATLIWLAGLVLLVLSAGLVISWQVLGNHNQAKIPGPLIIVAGLLFLLWAITQYGLLFFGPSGYAIPVGVPVLWYCGYQFIQAGKGEEK